jgi:hypothetical protein
MTDEGEPRDAPPEPPVEDGPPPPVEDPAAWPATAPPQPPAPAPGRRLPPRAVLVAGLLVVVVAAAIVVSRRDSEDLRVLEAGVSQVREANGLTFGSEAGEDLGQPLVSWAVVLENTTDDRSARDTHVHVELLDESGDVVDDGIWVVDMVPPNQRTAISGHTDEHTSEVADVRAAIEEIDRWEQARGRPSIEVDDLEVGYSSENAPIVRLTATSEFDDTIGDYTIGAIYRDRQGHILAGSSSRSGPDPDPPLEPGEPVPITESATFTIPDLATVEVYIAPADPL